MTTGLKTKNPLPDKELIRDLPKNADLSRTTSGGVAVHYRYRSKADKLRSGGKTSLHLGMVREMCFIPTPEYQLHPEKFPIPEKQLRGRRLTMLRNRSADAASAGSAAADEMSSSVSPSAGIESRQPIPLGQSDFRALRDEQCVYADKTAFIYQLCSESRKVFISRPRRFGKSLLVSAFETLFKHGLRDFQGLAIEKLWKDKTYKVVRLDFSEIRDFSDSRDFQEKFNALLINRFATIGFRYNSGRGREPLMMQLLAWLDELPVRSLVLLIDEYDSPLTASLDNKTKFDAVRTIMSPFFLMLKSRGGCLRFFFMTGITRYRQTNIFSELNNFDDISLNPAYSTLLGLTEEEIRTYFAFYLRKAAKIRNLSERELIEKLREYYDGYCFDGKTLESEARKHVFCPWSILNFFMYPEQGFVNYWYESGGQPTILMRYLADHDLEKPANFDEVRPIKVSELGEARKFDEIGREALLTQSGYLTIREMRPNGLAILGYPNREVAVSMAQLYAGELLKGKALEGAAEPLISETMATGSLDEVVGRFNQAVETIDYLRYPIRDEAACRAYLQVLLLGAAMLPKVENHSALGRSDLEVEVGGRRWVFEFKFARKSSEVQPCLEDAAKQIASRRYGALQPGKELLRAALVFSGEERRFVAWRSVR
ncbi:AAA family ATPase [uncultured Sutterella sp.]|uniref:AAA family ATPase n=1 Tax=uncultured Sutterella sp. TaxID=286133 RepID=UPI0026704781|nr:AAA family ATPase [uncultured Sutterella sp.]